MDRRKLLKSIALLTGGVVIGGELFLSGCKNPASNFSFSAADLAMLDEAGETILPTTADSPGAKATGIGKFMQTMVSDCYTAQQQIAFKEGMNSLQAACQKMHSKGFMECDAKQRHDFLVSLEKEAKTFNEAKDAKEKTEKEAAQKAGKPFEEAPPHYYTMLKQLTLMGYFTSEIGMTKALRHVPVPGKFDGNFAYKKGDKAFAE
jgi:hypothetical protein